MNDDMSDTSYEKRNVRYKSLYPEGKYFMFEEQLLKIAIIWLQRGLEHVEFFFAGFSTQEFKNLLQTPRKGRKRTVFMINTIYNLLNNVYITATLTPTEETR